MSREALQRTGKEEEIQEIPPVKWIDQFMHWSEKSPERRKIRGIVAVGILMFLSGYLFFSWRAEGTNQTEFTDDYFKRSELSVPQDGIRSFTPQITTQNIR